MDLSILYASLSWFWLKLLRCLWTGIIIIIILVLVKYRLQDSFLLLVRKESIESVYSFQGGQTRKMQWCLRRVGRLLNEESHALDLFDVVKSQATNVSIWVCIFALVNFIKNLGGIIATKHRQLPQCPVPPIIVAWHPTVFPVHKPLLHSNKQTNKPRKQVLLFSFSENTNLDEQWVKEEMQPNKQITVIF